jgi:hypothetical protein
MHGVRDLLAVVFVLIVVISTSQPMLEGVQNEPSGSHMVMHAMGAMPGTCHKCINKSLCCVVCAGTPAILAVAGRDITISAKANVAIFREPQSKNTALRPSVPPPKLGDLT